MSKNLPVSEHINSRLKPYSLYTLHSRAIPSMIDSLKPGQRKAIYTALKTAKSSFIKTASLGGYSLAMANFHHGNESMNDAIIGMAETFSNNAPLLEGSGSFGTRLVQEASSPRYTSVRLHKNFTKIFLDHEILPEREDPEDPEPIYYLPVIPMVLVNGASGIATGFATDILPRDKETIIRACEQYLNEGRVDTLVPSFPQFDGRVYASQTPNQWVCEGKFSWKSKTQLEITELPIGFDREKYVKHLEKLSDNGLISSYDDNCSSDGFNFSVKLKQNSSNLSDEQVFTKFKLRRKLTENITVIDENENLKIYDCAENLLKDFCDFRLSMYDKRYKYYIERDTEKRKYAIIKKEFIRMINDGEIDMKNSSRKEVKDFILKNPIAGFNVPEKFVERLLEIPVQHLSKDYIAELEKEVEKLEKNITHWQKKNHQEAFQEDLKSIA